MRTASRNKTLARQRTMKLIVLPDVRIGRVSMDAALDSVFGPAMLRRVHGPSLRVGDFNHKNQRVFKFKIDVSCVPPPIRRFFCGNELNITTRQTLDKKTQREWSVTNKLKLHFVGAEFFKIRPSFYLKQDEDGTVSLGGQVRHDAVLPPPLNGIAEDFMALNSAKEIRHFAHQLAEAGVISDVPA